jgi:putative endonuclease
MGRRQYHVYIVANRSASTLYVGMTGDIERRVAEHKQKLVLGFASRYNLDQVVYCELAPDVYSAIAREKQIKGWRRDRKIALIESVKPDWRDLSAI